MMGSQKLLGKSSSQQGKGSGGQSGSSGVRWARVCWGRENPLGLSGILSVDRESESYMEGRSEGKRIQE